MVTIANYEKRQGADGEFFLLNLQGDIEIVVSQVTGLPYATAKKCKLSTTFDEATCAALVGRTMPGSIIKVPIDEPYEYTIPNTGEVIQLDYRYTYSPQEIHQTAEEAVFNKQAVA